MKVLVIGMGAVGCAIAIATANAGMETAVVAREETAKAIRANGLKRTGIFDEITVSSECITVYENIDQIKVEYDYIAVAVKTMANKTVADELAKNRNIIGRNGKIVLFQNGWGNDETYLAYFSASKVFNARVITGFERTAPWVTKVTVHNAPIARRKYERA